MAKKLIKWRVSEKPKGDYPSFRYRAWPQAYVGENSVVQIVSTKKGLGNSEGYNPYAAKTGDHSPLRIMVRIPNDMEAGGWSWRYLMGEFKTLAEAKDAAEKFWERHIGLLPLATDCSQHYT